VIKLFFLNTRGRQSDAEAMYNPSALGKELKARISKITILFILSLLIGDALLKVMPPLWYCLLSPLPHHIICDRYSRLESPR